MFGTIKAIFAFMLAKLNTRLFCPPMATKRNHFFSNMLWQLTEKDYFPGIVIALIIDH